MIRLTFQPSNAGYSNAFILKFEGGLEVLFIRADVNADRVINLSDLSYLANFLFSGGASPTCSEAADVNDDGYADLNDILYLANFLFSTGPEPPQPYPDCGPDPTVDDLDCESYPPCE